MNILPDIVLYRGERISKKNNDNIEHTTDYSKFNDLTQIKYYKDIEYKKGDIIKNDAYLSISLNPDIALNFAQSYEVSVNSNLIFLTNRLFMYSTTKKEYIKSLKSWDNTFSDEFEILLPQDVSFKVIKKQHLKIKKKLYGFKQIYSEQYDNIILYDADTLPYVFPEKIKDSFFKKTTNLICF